MLLSATTIALRGGKKALAQFLKGKTNARYSPAAVMSITAYLEWEASCGRALDLVSGDKEGTAEEMATAPQVLIDLECNGKGITGGNNRFQMYEKFKHAFADVLTAQLEEIADDDIISLDGRGHGALFHMAEIARYQLAYRAGGKPIKAIEGHRRLWLYTNEKNKRLGIGLIDQKQAYKNNYLARAYSRWVDIIIGEQGKPEQWIELKSYRAKEIARAEELALTKGKPIKPWDLEKSVSTAMSLNKQFNLDRSAANMKQARLGYNDKKENLLVTVGPDFLWLFQKFDARWKDKQGKSQREVNVAFGSPNATRTVMGGLIRPIEGGKAAKGANKDIYDANMKSNIVPSQHIKYSDGKQLIADLVSAGFPEAADIIRE